MSKLSKSANDLYKRVSLINVSEKGNKVTSYRSPQKHWKKALLKGRTYKDTEFLIEHEKSLVARENCEEEISVDGPHKKFLSSLEKNFYASNTFISHNTESK